MTKMQKMLNSGYIAAMGAVSKTFAKIAEDEDLNQPKTKEEIVCEFLLRNGDLSVALSFLRGSCEHSPSAMMWGKVCVLCGEEIEDY